MRFVRPMVVVTDDSPDHIQQRLGEIVGYDPETNKCLWRFGFMPGSVLAEKFGVNTAEMGFTWAVCGRTGGQATDIFHGYGFNLPKEFQHIMDVGEPVEEEPTWEERLDGYDI